MTAWRFPSVLLVLAVALATAQASGADSPTLMDAANDSGSAPDIQSVVVSNDADGTYTFRINLAKLTSNAIVFIAMDTDLNLNTGQSGFEYVVYRDLRYGSAGLRHYDGSNLVNVPAPTLRSSEDAAGVTASINRSDIGNAGVLELSFQTLDTNGGVGNADYAPDSGTWLYAFTTGAPLQLSVAGFSVPRSVARGKTFRVTMRVTRSDTGEYVTAEAGGAVSCNAAIGKRRLQPTARGFIRVGDAEVGACSFRAPKIAAHKTIRGSISVSLNGVSTIRPFTVKIR